MISGFYFFNMSTKQLEIKNYLSEELELLSELLNKGEDTLLVSPTDSGKTRAINTYAKQNPQRRIAILCPTQALVDNLKQDCDIPAGYGKKWAQNTQFFNLLVTTYDSIQFFEETRFDAIFIDEAHYLAQAGIYRVKALEYMMGLECQKVLVTATPNVIERLELTDAEVINIVSEWYLNGMYPNILQDEDGNELCEITHNLFELDKIKNEKTNL